MIELFYVYFLGVVVTFMITMDIRILRDESFPVILVMSIFWFIPLFFLLYTIPFLIIDVIRMLRKWFKFWRKKQNDRYA